MTRTIQDSIIAYIENLSLNNVNKIIDFSFDIIENNVFLFISINNGSVYKKVNLNIEYDELDELYRKLYNSLKEKYINNPHKSINIFETIDLSNLDNLALNFNIKDNHQNKIIIEYKTFGYLNDILTEIKNDWLLLINERKTK